MLSICDRRLSICTGRCHAVHRHRYSKTARKNHQPFLVWLLILSFGFRISFHAAQINIDVNLMFVSISILFDLFLFYCQRLNSNWFGRSSMRFVICIFFYTGALISLHFQLWLFSYWKFLLCKLHTKNGLCFGRFGPCVVVRLWSVRWLSVWYFSSLCFSFVIKFVVCECVVHPNHRLWSNNEFLAYCRIRLNTSIRINLIIQTDNRFDQRNTLWLHMIPLVRTNMCFSHAFQSNKVIQLRCPNVAGEREISETDMGKMCKHILKALGGACCVLLLLLINK